jgi:hypothetical protein
VRRRVHRWALGAFLGLCGLLIQDFFHGLEIEGRWLVATWVALITMAAVVVLTADVTRPYMPSVSLLRQGRSTGLVWTSPDKAPFVTRSLRKRAERVSVDLLNLLAAYRANDPGRTPWWFSHPDWDSLPERERNRIFHEHSQRSSSHSTEFMNRYSVEFSTEALALFAEFRRRDLAAEEDRMWFEHPTNPLGVEKVAQSLGLWAKQL